MNPMSLITLFKNVVDVAWSTLVFRFDASQPGRFSRNDVVLLTGILFLLDVFSAGKGYFMGVGLLFGIIDAAIVWSLWRKHSAPHAGGFVCLFLIAGILRIVLNFLGMSWASFFLGAWTIYATYRMYIVPVEAPQPARS